MKGDEALGRQVCRDMWYLPRWVMSSCKRSGGSSANRAGVTGLIMSPADITPTRMVPVMAMKYRMYSMR
ncbi:hypothetical protein KCP74_17785 [Salmonella enterica subsp. enterica]|nr:hypothetical protein KCP74_17785 [Salmonella enterica subsp. enterica]